MNEKQMAQWEKTRKKGFDWFVIKNALSFPLMMLIAATLIPYLIGETLNLRELSIILVISFFTGFFNGWISYEWNERAYKKKVEASAKKF